MALITWTHLSKPVVALPRSSLKAGRARPVVLERELSRVESALEELTHVGDGVDVVVSIGDAKPGIGTTEDFDASRPSTSSSPIATGR